MSILIKGLPSEGEYKLTYKETTDKGRIAYLEGETIFFIGEILPSSHGKLVDIDARIKQIEKAYCEPCKADGKDHNEVRCRACWIDDAIGIFDTANAVIESEDER